jgi:hypothetical protein
MTAAGPTSADVLADLTLSVAVDRDARRGLVERTAAPPLDGIDAIEVLANAPGSPGHQPGAPRQRTLLVRLLRGPVPDDLTVDRVRVRGGVRPDPRVNPVRVQWAYPAAAVADVGVTAPPGVTPADRALVAGMTAVPDRAGLLVVRTLSSGDGSTYLLMLLGPGGVGVPAGFDEPLAQAPFTFTVDCPSDLDCRRDRECPPIEATSPVLDYLARDYDALRTRLLDRLSTLLPNWVDRNPADPVVTLVELFAATGDRLAAWQDGVAAEAYLGTARRRTSLRRHARLLDYRVHEGCSARTWLVFTTTAEFTLPAGTPVADPPARGSVPATEPMTAAEVVEAGGVVFETCAPAVLLPGRNALALHSWGDPEHCLPVGATSAFVARTPATPDPRLRAGDVLILAPLGPDGTAATGDPTRRHAVRLVRVVPRSDPLSTRSVVLELHWSDADALPVPLPVAERSADGSARIVATALANVVLADHGGTIPAEPLDPPQAPAGRPYQPRLRRSGPAFADPPLADLMRTDVRPAAATVVPDPQRALAQLELDDGARTWLPRPDLLGSGRLAPHVVVEIEPGQSTRLRFGDGVTGRRPDPGTRMTATYRLGGGSGGNVGPDVLTRLLAPPGGAVPDAIDVTNPLRALGGMDPQPIDEVRELAPHAFRAQLRAVTSADHAEVAMADAAVQRAVARRRWTGSWYTQEVTVDPVGGGAVPGRISELLEVRRMAGTDVEVAQPIKVALEIVLGVCVAPGYQRADVAAALTRMFSAGRLPTGGRGFFHADNFTFGQPLFLSDVVATAMGVAGVAWVDVGDDDTGLRFRRLGRPPAGEVARGWIEAAAREVLRADSDSSNPENGRLDVLVRGRS